MATIDMGRKEGEPGPRLIQCGLGHNRHEPKTGGVPFLGRAATPFNTTSPGLRFTSVPSGILIHPALWPQ